MEEDECLDDEWEGQMPHRSLTATKASGAPAGEEAGERESKISNFANESAANGRRYRSNFPACHPGVVGNSRRKIPLFTGPDPEAAC